MSELNFMPAHKLAAMIRQRQVSAVEVLDAHLAQNGERGRNVRLVKNAKATKVAGGWTAYMPVYFSA